VAVRVAGARVVCVHACTHAHKSLLAVQPCAHVYWRCLLARVRLSYLSFVLCCSPCAPALPRLRVVLAGCALVELWVVGFASQFRGVSMQAGLPASLVVLSSRA
jgi:hypothetical protein